MNNSYNQFSSGDIEFKKVSCPKMQSSFNLSEPAAQPDSGFNLEKIKDILLERDTLLLIGLVVLLFGLYFGISFGGMKLLGGEKKPIVFVLYYVDWCPHCQSVKPEWEKLENDKELKDKDIVIKKVDCEDNQKLIEKKNIEGFPTIMISKNGKEEPYNGGREYADFKGFLLSQ